MFHQFCVTNGVKQGGIISPMFFNLYMDDLSVMLNCSSIGGYIRTSFINHLCYADDLCLISLSSSGMQHLLNICNEYATTQKLLYNGSTSFSLWFDCTKAALKKLKIAYNNSLRRFMFLPWRNSATEMFANLGIYSFDEMLRIFVFSFCSRVTASHNQLIIGLCTAHSL